jgi:hypothetical protein
MCGGHGCGLRGDTHGVTDVILVATIIVFFGAAALLVQVLDRTIVRSGAEADPGEDAEDAEEDEAADLDLEPDRTT